MARIFSLEECYRILGLDPKRPYSPTEIKKAFRKLAFKYHPDHNNNEENSKRIFQDVKEAYDTLTNPHFRYMQNRKSEELNIIINFTASFNEGFFGKIYDINVNAGSNYYEKEKLKFEVENFKFTLPPGSHGMYEKVLYDKGLRRIRGNESEIGDLIIRVGIKGSPKFRLEGKNVISQVQCPLSKLLKGGKIDVETMYGIKEGKIFPGTPPGGVVKIPDCGVDKKHFHIAILDPIFPSVNELKNNEIWKKFDIDWEEQ